MSDKDIESIYKDMLGDQLTESEKMKGKNYTFVLTTRSRTDARRKAANYPNSKVVQLDNDYFGVIVPA